MDARLEVGWKLAVQEAGRPIEIVITANGSEN